MKSEHLWVHFKMPSLYTRGYRGHGHCVLKGGSTRTFPGNQDATLKWISELTFISFCGGLGLGRSLEISDYSI